MADLKKKVGGLLGSLEGAVLMAILIPYEAWMERRHGPMRYLRGEPGDHWGPDCRCRRCVWLEERRGDLG